MIIQVRVVWILQVQVQVLVVNMTIKIHKINKNDLTYIDSMVTGMANTSGMTISHYADSTKRTSATIPYEIEGVEKHIPLIEEAEFSPVIRKKVDFMGIGVNGQTIKDIGRDTGKYDYVKNVPKRPLDLPPGFQEIHKQ